MQNDDEMLKRVRSIDRTIWRNQRVPPLLQLVVAIMIILIIISYLSRARAADGWQQCMQAAYALSVSTGDRNWLRVELFCRLMQKRSSPPDVLTMLSLTHVALHGGKLKQRLLIGADHMVMRRCVRS